MDAGDSAATLGRQPAMSDPIVVRPATGIVLRRPIAIGLVLFATALVVLVPMLLWLRASVLRSMPICWM